MAMAQLSHTGQKHKTSKESVLFPHKIATDQQSMVLVKRLLAISVSCITYLRGLFPESSYGTRYLDDLCLKILREDKSCLGSLQIVKCTKMSFAKGVSSEEIKKGSILLIRKLYLLMQNLGPLPNDITLTMKLFYYSDVTPDDYQPPGFKEDSSPDNLLFDGDPVNLKVGSISTGFHILKVRVTTESKRMRTLGSSLIQETGPTEISHQGLDCDEEEEGSTKTYTLDLAFSQEETMGPRKKRKVSEPVQLLPAGRN
ncbi:HORMA domain-containing protein 2 isoform X10 [Lepidochelys kempii]|uniref:HORMA domain-containing protein 2 isoform X10 n=1 Tax=Lepidochelys kempii TaxID=8472 RepID=UPI002095468E|nr:HORMA domain-containing protein 2 isoform X4 [Caretta caretta]